MDPPATAINVCKYNDFKLFPAARSDKNSTFFLSFHWFTWKSTLSVLQINL